MRRTNGLAIYHMPAEVPGWRDKKRVISSWLRSPFNKVASRVTVVCPNGLIK